MEVKRTGVAVATGHGAKRGENLTACHHYEIECFGPDGNLKWLEEFDNLVVDTGLDDIVDTYYGGANYTAAHYVGLTDGTPTPADDDTMAAHAGWAEVEDYDEADRPDLVMAASAGGVATNSANKAVYTINSPVTAGGAFITSDDTKGGTAGTLVSVGAFAAGDRAAQAGDTINVTVSFTLAVPA